MTAASEAMDIPPELVSRSASARATANGTDTEKILEAWAGGAPASAPSSAPAEDPAPDATEDAPAETAAAEPASPEPEQREAADPPPLELEPAAAVAVMEETEPEKVVLEPVELPERLRTTARIGVWTGAVLGLFAFVMAASSLSGTVTVTGEDAFSPIFVASPGTVLIGVALVSLVFGAVVGSFSRAAASWVNPAMQLKSSKSSTAWLGAVVGLVLGIAGGAVLAYGIGTAMEGSEPVMVQLPILSTLLAIVIGGAILGGITTMATQVFAVPVAVDDDEDVEVEAVKTRLRDAVGIPVAGLILLVVLVLPMAWTFLESNHLTSGGAAIIAIVASSGILAFASLAGSRPNMRIGRGELLVAVLGIGIVVLILFAVLSNLSGSHEGEAEGGEEAAIVRVLT